MTSLRDVLRDIDWRNTAALVTLILLALSPVRWLWRAMKRRLLVPMLREALTEVLKDDLAPIKTAAQHAKECADALATIVTRLETVDDDITILFDHALGIDRRSWEERRANPRPGTADRRQGRPNPPRSEGR